MLEKHFPTFATWRERLQLGGPARWSLSHRGGVDRWTAQQTTLLHMLAVATEVRLPLAPLLAGLATDHRGRYRRTLARLAERIDEGTPLAAALEQTPGALPPAETLAVRFGQQTGIVTDVLAAAAHSDGGRDRLAADRLYRMAGYAWFFAMAAIPIISFILWRIAHYFEQIYSDFQIDTPPAFQTLISIRDAIEAYWYVPIVLLAAMAILFYSPRLSNYAIRIWLLGFSQSAARLRGAEILCLLAAAHRAGRPLPGALSTLARYHYDPRLRRQLLYARNEVEQGAPIWASLESAGMLTGKEARALERAAGAEATVWTMQRLADLRRDQFADRMKRYLDLLHPALILLAAAAVLTIAIGTLSPLFSLVNALS